MNETSELYVRSLKSLIKLSEGYEIIWEDYAQEAKGVQQKRREWNCIGQGCISGCSERNSHNEGTGSYMPNKIARGY